MLIVFIILISQPSLHEGWPIPVIKQSYDAQFGGPKAIDINGDGMKEVIFAGGNGSLGGILYTFSVDGIQPSGWPVYTGEPPLRFISAPAIGDIDGDGNLEILIGSAADGAETGSIYAYNPNGTIVDGFPIPAPEGLDIRMPITLGLINEDDIPDLVVVFDHEYVEPTTDLLVVIDPVSGGFLNGWPISIRFFTSRPIIWPEAKISAYYSLEQDSNFVGSWGFDGIELPGWPKYIPGQPGLAMPYVADIDQDSSFELVSPWMGTSPPDSRAFLYVFKSDGSVLQGFPVTIYQDFFHSPPAIADIDQDGSIEIIQDGLFRILIFESNGQFYQIFSDIMQSGGEPAIADVDGDGQLEIVMERSDYVYNDSSIVCAFRLDGSQPEGWPLHVIGAPTGTPLIDDLDGDGLLEMVVFTQDLPWIRPDTGWLYLFDLPAPFDSAMVPWGQYAHDLWNSGIYGFNPPVSVAERGPLKIPSTYQVVYRNGIPFLTFTLTQPQKFYIDLYDVSGRRVWKKFLQLPQGSHTIPLSPNTSPGIYILNLKSTINKTIKVIKLR